MACSKMVGFEVTPRTPFATRSARPPLRTLWRLRLSIQGLCPCSSNIRCRLVAIVVLLAVGGWSGVVVVVEDVVVELVEQLLGPLGHVLAGEAELAQHGGARRRGTEVVDRHGVVGP